MCSFFFCFFAAYFIHDTLDLAQSGLFKDQPALIIHHLTVGDRKKRVKTYHWLNYQWDFITRYFNSKWILVYSRMLFVRSRAISPTTSCALSTYGGSEWHLFASTQAFAAIFIKFWYSKKRLFKKLHIYSICFYDIIFAISSRCTNLCAIPTSIVYVFRWWFVSFYHRYDRFLGWNA